MPFDVVDELEPRREFVRQRANLGQSVTMTALCERFGISRECGYKWWRRFVDEGLRGVVVHSRAPLWAAVWRERWWKRIELAHRQTRRSGPRMVRWQLQQNHPRERVPSVRTIARWLAKAGKLKRRKRRAKPGPGITLPGRLVGRCCNDVWTIDLKGKITTRDGRTLNALTVRDLASRLVLCVTHAGDADHLRVARIVDRLFKRYGLPRAMRMDNGGPFGGEGPRGWTQLTVRWVQLGIAIEYGRPACPQDNPHHEQMHGVLKRKAAQPVSVNVAAQQCRLERWRRWYNHHRPHESLGMRTPAECYRPSPRKAFQPRAWRYPSDCEVLQINSMGRTQWRNKQRLIGRAFARHTVGAKALNADVSAIYFGPHLIGHLHATDPAGLRPVLWRTQN